MSRIIEWFKAGTTYRPHPKIETTGEPYVSVGVAKLTANDREARETILLLADQIENVMEANATGHEEALGELLSSAMNCPPAWAGEHSDTYAYQLAGALSRIMLPDDETMPQFEIRDTIERINQIGPGPADQIDES